MKGWRERLGNLITRSRERLKPPLNRGRRIYNRLMEKRATAVPIRTFQEFGRDHGGDLAAIIAYFAFLSIFPLLLGITAVLGLFLPSETIQQELIQFFEQNVPGSADLLKTNISHIITARNTLGIVSIIGLFWAGSGMFGALGRAINGAWGIKTYRPWLIRKLRDIGFALGTGVLFFLSLGISVMANFIRQLNLPAPNLVEYGSRVLAFLLMLAIFLILYKNMPNTRLTWRDVWPGAILAAGLFELARTFFILYITRFANYQVIYGPIASAIILLVWIYYSAIIVIIGAEFNSELAAGAGRIKKPTGG